MAAQSEIDKLLAVAVHPCRGQLTRASNADHIYLEREAGASLDGSATAPTLQALLDSPSGVAHLPRV